MKRVPPREKDSSRKRVVEIRLKKSVARFEKMIKDKNYSGKRTPNVD